MSRRVVETLKQMPERRRFLRGMVAWVGFKQVPIEYARAGRVQGRGASYRSLFRLALEALASFSDVPLNLAAYFGTIVATISGSAALVLLGLAIAGEATSGTIWILIAVLFLGGVQLITVGILGRYLARVHAEALGRPLYLVDEIVEPELGQASGLTPPAEAVRGRGDGP
jgi:dolichol-phosphate mannosyltransferase